MSVKVTRLVTYWTAEGANTVIECRDVLRDQLWETYGDAVVDMLREAAIHETQQDDQVAFEFDDDIEFEAAPSTGGL